MCALALTSCAPQEQDVNATALVTEPEVSAAPEPASAPVNTDTTTTAAVVRPVAPEKAAVERASVEETAKPESYPGPAPLPGAILPGKRIIAYYGNLLSKRMGILGELPPEQMLAKLDEEVAKWAKADSLTPVQPALHAIVVTAQGHPSAGGKYRLRMTHKMIDDVLELAKQRDAIVFLDIQVGQSTLQQEIPPLEKYLKMPNVHLGIDAEFSMKEGGIPGRSIGTFDAEDINYATGYLADLVKTHNIPPKLLIVHRFTQRMITNYENIKLRPETQVIMHMDGWGSPALKKDTFRRYIQKEPVQFTGFKLFYKNDLRKSPRLMTPEEILGLKPTPLYIQYQ
ncbi:lipoprotein [Pontibacter korlensis]|uniref:Lipoprotein n=1 Tax=Pontibacter korlensis TaxID=400092 RepID=A0A0E3V025_9BACT|nr:lipoprotein [Pontibacter korlensis]